MPFSAPSQAKVPVLAFKQLKTAQTVVIDGLELICSSSSSSFSTTATPLLSKVVHQKYCRVHVCL